MNAPGHLEMFEPDGTDAVRLLERYVKEANMHAQQAQRFELLRMPGAEARADAMMFEALRSAHVLAAYLDLLREAGLE